MVLETDRGVAAAPAAVGGVGGIEQPAFSTAGKDGPAAETREPALETTVTAGETPVPPQLEVRDDAASDVDVAVEASTQQGSVDGVSTGPPPVATETASLDKEPEAVEVDEDSAMKGPGQVPSMPLDEIPAASVDGDLEPAVSTTEEAGRPVTALGAPDAPVPGSPAPAAYTEGGASFIAAVHYVGCFKMAEGVAANIRKARGDGDPFLTAEVRATFTVTCALVLCLGLMLVAVAPA